MKPILSASGNPIISKMGYSEVSAEKHSLQHKSLTVLIFPSHLPANARQPRQIDIYMRKYPAKKYLNYHTFLFFEFLSQYLDN